MSENRNCNVIYLLLNRVGIVLLQVRLLMAKMRSESVRII